MASILAKSHVILARKSQGQEFSDGAVERYDNIAGANGNGGTAVGKYSPPIVVVRGEYDGVDATNGAGDGAFYPISEWLDGSARADGIGVTAVGEYSPPIVVLEGEYNGIIVAGSADGGAIDPFAERSGGLTRADGIGGAAVGPYSPPMVVEVGGEYVVLPR
jgi:hypothetical protein